jgi:hypothetical protein
MVARMTLAQIAGELGVDEESARAALNRLGVVSPAAGTDTVLVLLDDLSRAGLELERRARWAAAAGRRPVA